MTDKQSEGANELKPCPFCDSTDVHMLNTVTLRGNPNYYWIECTGCGLKTGANKDKDNLTRQWNTRADSKLVETLKNALPYMEHAVKFFKYQRAGREFWPNREEAEANIAEAKQALKEQADERASKRANDRETRR